MRPDQPSPEDAFPPISARSRKSRDILSSAVLSDAFHEDDVSVALCQFVAETCNRQLQQFNPSELEDDTILLNIGEGLDYSVDISRINEGQIVAVKHLKIDADDAPSTSRGRSPQVARRIWKALKELQIMTHPPIATCPNVLLAQGFGWTYVEGSTTTPALVVEYADRGHLRHFLGDGNKKTDSEKWQIVSGVGRGLLVLHQSGVVHGDLKLENILMTVTEDGEAVSKISDFGSSIIAASEERHVYWGTDMYNPPEIRLLGSYLMQFEQLVQCDTWAFGLLLLEVFLDGDCYMDDNIRRCFQSHGMQNFESACIRRLSMLPFEEVSLRSRVLDLLAATLNRTPEDRVTLHEFEKLITDTHTQETVDVEFPKLEADHSNGRGIIDLTDSFTARAILKGRGVSTFSPEKIPWSVQLEIVERYRQLLTMEDDSISGFASMNLAVCYYLGLGVERNFDSVSQYIHSAAVKGAPEAQFIIYPLSEFLGFNLKLEELAGISASEELSILMEARNRRPYYQSPIAELVQLRSKHLAQFRLQHEDLHSAVGCDDFATARSLIEAGARDHPGDHGQTALMLAFENGNIEMVGILLESGSDPSIADEDGITALHFLCMFPDDDIGTVCHLLKASGSSRPLQVEAFSPRSWPLPEYWDELLGTPLQWAVASGNVKAVEALLSLGADPTNESGWFSPIQIASSLFLADILELLLAKPVQIDPKSHGLFYLNESHPFRPILIHGKKLPEAIHNTIKALASDGGVDIRTPWGETPLMKLAMSNISATDVLIARELLQTCDVTKDGPRFSTIQTGIMGCNGSPSNSLTEITLMLVDAGFSCRKTSTDSTSWPGWNAMHWAAATRSLGVVRRLYRKDPDLLRIPTESETRETPLHIAAHSSYGLEMAKLLLELGADPCAYAGYGQTPLVNCVGESRLHMDMAKFDFLLNTNAVNGYITQNNGSTIVHLVALRAAKLDQESLPGYELLAYILSRPELKALVNQANAEGMTPLHLVCTRPDYSAIKLLVEAGADVHHMTAEPNAMSPLGLVLEIARLPGEGSAGRDLRHIWHQFSYRAARYLSDYTAGSPQDKRFTPLHIAAYCGYVEEVKRLVDEGADISARDARGLTPRELLGGLLLQYIDMQLPINEAYAQRARHILEYLNSRHAGLAAGGDATIV